MSTLLSYNWHFVLSVKNWALIGINFFGINETSYYAVLLISLIYIRNTSTICFDIFPKQRARKLQIWAKKQAKSDQFSQSVAGYKWNKKSAIFDQVTEKGQT